MVGLILLAVLMIYPPVFLSTCLILGTIGIGLKRLMVDSSRFLLPLVIRQTFASLLLQQGESLHYVKEQMGHASIKTTVDVYGHITPGLNRKAVNKLDDPIQPKLRLVGAAS